jgi:protein SCO1/2
MSKWTPLPLLALVVVLVTGCGGSKSSPKLPGNAKSATSASFDGAVATPPKPAPPTVLDDHLGHRVSLVEDRGKVVLLTFLYTHCPDVCPLITANLHSTLGKLGANASKVRVVAVSVDPRGDTPSSVTAFLKVHEMTGRMEYLLGSASTLGRVWQEWNVGSQRDAAKPQFIAHSGLVYGIAASGRVTTLYPANFKPAQIVHDVPLLLQR